MTQPRQRGDARRAARELIDQLPGGRRAVLALMLLTLAEVAVQVVVALASRELLLQVTGNVSGFPVGPAAVAAVAALVTFVVVRARHRWQEKLAIRGREGAVRRLAGHLHGADVEDLSATPMAGLREVVMTDVDFGYRFLLDAACQLTVLAAWTVAAIALTAWLSLPILGVLVALGLVVACTVVSSVRRHLALTQPRFTHLAAASQRARDVVEVERVVMARQFGLGGLFVDRFIQAHEAFTAVAYRQGLVTASIKAWFSSLGAIMFLAVVLTGGSLVLGDGLSVGSLVAILFVLGQLLAAVTALGDFGARLAESTTAAVRLMAFWNAPAPHTLSSPTSDSPIKSVGGSGLRFGYANGPAILSGADLELRRGRIAALTAATGAGKSTLAMVATGILRAQEGQVRYETEDGWSGTPVDLPAGRVLYVGSRPILMAGSLRDNLLLDEDRPLDPAWGEDLQAVVSRVTARALPFALDDVVVGPNGTGLSSGQAQLVQLARAVLREPDVVVLDEATGALDLETEAAVQQALLTWCERRVTLVISHRTCPWTDAAQDHWRLLPDPNSRALRTEREALT